MSVYVPPTRESIYSALFAQLSTAVIGSNPAFLTTGRNPSSQEQINSVEKPAMFMVQIDEDLKQNISGLPYVAEMMVEVYIFVSQPDDLVLNVPQLNNLVDATILTLKPPFPGQSFTLNGLVKAVVLRGKVEYFLGLRGIINAFAVFRVVMVAPNLQAGLG
jgi:hypothetical protein